VPGSAENQLTNQPLKAGTTRHALPFRQHPNIDDDDLGLRVQYFFEFVNKTLELGKNFFYLNPMKLKEALNLMKFLGGEWLQYKSLFSWT
jgi:hypothetical protein